MSLSDLIYEPNEYAEAVVGAKLAAMRAEGARE